MDNNFRTIFILLLIVCIVGFASFFVIHQKEAYRKETLRLDDHASVIASSVWQYEKDAPVAYLRLAAQANHYKKIVILDDFGKQFYALTIPVKAGFESFLGKMGLLPIHRLEKDIIYRGKTIGKIRVDQQNREIFTYSYLLICMGLTLLVIWFLLNLLHAKKTLATRVIERTADLKESQERLLAILDNAEAIIYLKDAKGSYITVNRQYETLFDVDRNRIQGLQDTDIFPHQIARKFQENDQKILSEKTAIQFEESAPDSQGNLRDYLSVKFPLKRTDGQVYAVCGISTDITDRKKAEKELHHLRNYLSNIIDSMPSILIGVDPGGKVTQWNSRAENATGFKSGEAMGKPLAQVYPQLSEEMARVKHAIQTRSEQQSKKQAHLKDNEVRYEDITVYPLVANGVEGAVIRVDDVTDQVHLEEMMVQSEKMLSVGGLAAGMAHEINNPLAGMMQTASVMKSRLEKLDMPANIRAADELGVSLSHIQAFMEKRGILRMVDAVNESGKRVAEIVDNMLSFARKTDAMISSHEPDQLMDQILELAATDYDLKKQYDFKTIKIIKEYDDDLPMLHCEGGKIQQVLLNIFRNGAQAMQTQGTYDQGVPRFTLRLSKEADADMLRMEIQDNGPGMDTTIQKRIFEPFFTTKQPGEGTGLGLSVSYFIITENHGGTMDVVSAPGRGATFVIRLPLNR